MIAARAFVGNSVSCGKRHRMRLSPSLNGVEGCTQFSVLAWRSRLLYPLLDMPKQPLIRSPNYYKECRQC